MKLDLFAVRSLLFLPASNPRAIARAREAGADLTVLDLEDAVRPEDKALARAAAVDAVREPWPMPVAIRLNHAGSPWHDEDVEAVRHSGADAVVVPRAASADEVMAIKEWAARPTLAMVETAAGVLAAVEIAREAAALIAGTNDLAADLRLPPDAGREPLQMALQSIMLAARAAGIAVFDGVFNGLKDPKGFLEQAASGRRLGFDGKSLIHPDQIEPCHRAFAPSEAEIERARRLLAAATGGAERFDDEMIERMHVEAAERLLARASQA
ncbi:CoA ester lyase [Sphingomonas sp.]|uniref:HpcH/HpaI aldolase/citrate lyase family protein n=1 Tax=Sphingomonas sp. TaxID=28214 RepID=UPI00182E76C9|nr:CoA ester lyase [Sphingomonas sp.]MBA3511533.1 CoA ester lyase [Sphingomonas sp.]